MIANEKKLVQESLNRWSELEAALALVGMPAAVRQIGYTKGGVHNDFQMPMYAIRMNTESGHLEITDSYDSFWDFKWNGWDILHYRGGGTFKISTWQRLNLVTVEAAVNWVKWFAAKVPLG